MNNHIIKVEFFVLLVAFRKAGVEGGGVFGSGGGVGCFFFFPFFFFFGRGFFDGEPR